MSRSRLRLGMKHAAIIAVKCAVVAFFIAPWAVAIFLHDTPQDRWATQLFFVLLALNGVFLLVVKIIDHYRGRVRRVPSR